MNSEHSARMDVIGVVVNVVIRDWRNDMHRYRVVMNGIPREGDHLSLNFPTDRFTATKVWEVEDVEHVGFDVTVNLVEPDPE